MGVKFRFVTYAGDLKSAEKGLLAAIKRVSEIEEKLTDYDPESELMRLGQNAAIDKPTKVSDDLMQVLEIAAKVNCESDGAFDPTIGNLSKLWRTARRKQSLPEKKSVADAVATTGFENVVLNVEKKTVTLKKLGMQFDLGGIAKGFAADEAIKVLRANGLDQCLVDASGDVTVGEAPPNKSGWKIAIGSEESGQFVTLTNASVATSGDNFQYLEIDGKKYSHIIDPSTGYGTTHQNLVTVISKTNRFSGTFADAYASAFSVMDQALIPKKINGTKNVFVRIQNKAKPDSEMIQFESKNFRQLLNHKK